MNGKGIHFSITPERVEALVGAADDDALAAQVRQLEDEWDEDNLAQSDTAWDAIHRALGDGQLEVGGGEYPLNHCILGPRQLHHGSQLIVSLVKADEVKDVAKALGPLDSEWLRARYDSVVPQSYSREYGVEDRDYTCEWFENVRELFLIAARRGRAVVFTLMK